MAAISEVKAKLAPHAFQIAMSENILSYGFLFGYFSEVLKQYEQGENDDYFTRYRNGMGTWTLTIYIRNEELYKLLKEGYDKFLEHDQPSRGSERFVSPRHAHTSPRLQTHSGCGSSSFRSTRSTLSPRAIHSATDFPMDFLCSSLSHAAAETLPHGRRARYMKPRRAVITCARTRRGR